MSVLDTSAVVDFLLGQDGSRDLLAIMTDEGGCAAPDVLIFETLAVLRRMVARSVVTPERGRSAVGDLGAVSVELYPSLVLRLRAWEMRENFTVADALFVALAEALDEPLATKDRGLAAAARRHTGVHVVELG